MTVFTLSREQLLADLYQAYLDARQHKRNKPYQQRFEAHLDRNLMGRYGESAGIAAIV